MELFWEHGSCTLELVSCRFRRQRQGPWTRAGGRKKQGLKLFLGSSESNVWHYGLPAAGPIRPSVPWCFAVSEAPARSSLWNCFGSMGAALWSWFLVGSEGNDRVLGPEMTRADGRKKQGLKLVFRQFRKQRLALWAAGRGPDPSFSAMVFCRPHHMQKCLST